jgi:hypothetical protein
MRIGSHIIVMPAKAGIQSCRSLALAMDSHFRGNDEGKAIVVGRFLARLGEPATQ